MQIEPLVDFNNAKSFLLPYEPFCVQLASCVRRGSDSLFVIKDEKKDDATRGILYAKGTFLHCIPSLKDCGDSFSQVLSPFLCSRSVKCINGSLTESEILKEMLLSAGKKEKGEEIKPYQTNRYILMTLTPADYLAPAESSLANDDEIRRLANPQHDSDLIFELQKNYVKEEVAPAGKNPGDMEINLVLRQIIKNQLCLALFSDGEAVAKVNTNAIGWNCVQIGGLYTHPLYRRNGYAYQLLYNLCRRILRAGKTAVLYVKEKNSSALALYKKIGFKEAGKFEIAYFE